LIIIHLSYTFLFFFFFFFKNILLKITKRGAPPNGGGEIIFRSPIVRSTNPIQCMDSGRIKRIRGIAYGTRISPQTVNRVMEAARSSLTKFIPDVFVYTDVYRGPESGRYIIVFFLFI